jgi:aminopeptidase-like protein
LDFGQVCLPGREVAEVFFSTYLCHPSMANNELSGPVVQMTLLKVLSQASKLRLTYRGALTTETIGTLCYLDRFGQELKNNALGGCVVSCVGDPGPFTFVRSRRGVTMSDKIFEHVITHAVPGRRIDVRDWHPIGSDERQYCSPGFDLPVGSFSRSRFENFPEYHTSLDNLDFVTEAALQDSLKVLLRVCQSFEMNLYPRRTNPYGEPQLGKRGLYSSDRTSVDRITLDRMFILGHADGRTSMLQIAEKAGRAIWSMLEALEGLDEARLIILSSHAD